MRRNFSARHAGPGKGAQALNLRIGRRRRRPCRTAHPAPFRTAAGYRSTTRGKSRVPGKERLTLPPNRGMNQCLQPAQILGLGQHPLGQRRPVHPARTGRPRKGRFDLADQRPFRPLQFVDDRIGVEHRHAGVGEHPRDGRFAHADRAGEAEDHGHRVSSSLSSSSCSRGGEAPKKWKNAQDACPISTVSPSIASRPATSCGGYKGGFQWLIYQIQREAARPDARKAGQHRARHAWKSGHAERSCIDRAGAARQRRCCVSEIEPMAMFAHRAPAADLPGRRSAQ